MKREQLFAILTLLLVSFAAGCDIANYGGIPLRPGRSPSDLQQLALHARGGDKPSQLELGIRYEEGNGVPRDVARARWLYERAARDEGGEQMIYIPASRPGGRGAWLPINKGIKLHGLEAAKERLRRLDAEKIK